MITPGTIAEWTLFAGMLGSCSPLAVSGYRRVLREEMAPEGIRTRPFTAAATSRPRVSR